MGFPPSVGGEVFQTCLLDSILCRRYYRNDLLRQFFISKTVAQFLQLREPNAAPSQVLQLFWDLRIQTKGSEFPVE